MSSPDAPALFYAALTVSAPTFGWVVAGLLLRRVGLLTEPVINRVSQLAFRYGLPAMLFAGAAQVDYSALGSARYLLAGVLATLPVTAGIKGTENLPVVVFAAVLTTILVFAVGFPMVKKRGVPAAPAPAQEPPPAGSPANVRAQEPAGAPALGAPPEPSDQPAQPAAQPAEGDPTRVHPLVPPTAGPPGPTGSGGGTDQGQG